MAPKADGFTRSEPERARRRLSGGILVFRWVAFAWMLLLNLTRVETYRHAVVAGLGIAAAGTFTLWLTVRRGEQGRFELWTDLGISMGLVLISNYVVRGGLFFATAYPASTALSWGAGGGIPKALLATLGLGVALVLSRPIGGTGFAEFRTAEVLSLVNGIVYYLLAGLATGVVARHLDRSAVQLRSAIDDAIRSREHSARLAQHKALARAIHDSVLQALAFINKRGRELAEEPSVPGSEVLELANLAGEQEKELRALIRREPEDIPAGSASLGEALELTTREVPDLPVTVSAVGSIWFPAAHLEQLMGAVRQALENVREHAEASRAAIFAEVDDGTVIVSVRDDGCGFIYSEEQLRAEGKVGMLGSMKGRIEDLGGKMKVHTAPGAGTEVEFRVPAADQDRP